MKLNVTNISKRFNTKTAVDDFSMELHTGECVGLIGPNGAGKSTLLNMIADLIEPTTGNVLLNSKPISNMKENIGYLPQHPNFYQWMTAQETLMFMGQLSGISKEALKISIPDIITKVGLDGEEHTKVGTFSGGMKQRLGIAQTLLHKPSLIVMDEPVSALDPIGRREVLNILNDIKQETTILLSTHILEDAEEVCERLVIIKDGVKLEDTTMTELLNRNSDNKIRFYTAENSHDWVEMIKQLDYVKHAQVDGHMIKVEVTNIETNKDALLKHALDANVDIIKFEIVHDTLEEIFLNLVVPS